MVGINYPTDRISSLSEQPKPVGRTPAQNAASRLNGSRSRGPVTSEGKKRSRVNAMKHGLFARVISAQSDFRSQKTLYREIRRQLIAEFDPQGFTDSLIIDSLASEYVRLARVSKMMELLERGPKFPVDEDQKWREIELSRRDMTVINQFIRHSDSKAPFAFRPKEAGRIAQHVVKMVTNVQFTQHETKFDAKFEGANFEIPLPPPSNDAPTDSKGERPAGTPVDGAGKTKNDAPKSKRSSRADIEFEKKEEREFDEVVKLIGSASRRLGDQTYVASVLCGATKPQVGDGRRLRGLLERICESLKRKDKAQEEIVGRMKFFHWRSQEQLALAPQQLMTLYGYLERIERAIEKKLKQLGRR